MFRVVFAAVFALCSAAALAQALPVPRVVWPSHTTGRVVTYAPMTADAANAAKFSFGVAANGSVFANASTLTPTPGGASIPVGVSGGVPPARLARAFGNFFRRTLPVVSTVAAVYQLGEELGFGVDPQTGFLTAPSSGSPSSGSGWYGVKNSTNERVPTTGVIPWPSDTSNAALCAALGGYIGGSLAYMSGPNCVMDVSGGLYSYSLGGQSGEYVCPSGQVYSGGGCSAGQPVMTAQEVEDLIASRSSWPADSAVGDALREVIASGEDVVVDPQSVTGPASAPASSSSATDPATGNVTTTSVTNHYSYADNRVTISPVTTVSVTSAQGVPLGSSVNTDPPPDPLPFPCGGPGLPACSVKVDETSTPATVTMADPFPQIQQDHAEKLDAIKAADGAAWEGVRDFFFLPPAATCVPFDMPVVMGVQVPPLNPCPVVGGIQQVVGVLWAIGAFWVMLGWVREVV